MLFVSISENADNKKVLKMTNKKFIEELEQINESLTARDLKKFENPKSSITIEGLNTELLNSENFVKIVFDLEEKTTKAQIKESVLREVFFNALEITQELDEIIKDIYKNSLFRAFNHLLTNWLKENNHLFL